MPHECQKKRLAPPECDGVEESRKRRRNWDSCDESSSGSERDPERDSESDPNGNTNSDPNSDPDDDSVSNSASNSNSDSDSEAPRSFDIVGLPYYSSQIDLLREERYSEPRNVQRWFFQEQFRDVGVFRRFFRMNPSSFETFLHRIEGHQVFQNTNSVEQTAVRYQLAVFLYRLGRKGLGGTDLEVASEIGISEGSVRNFTSRVLAAILSLQTEMIRWPTQEEKDAHKQRVCNASDLVFSGCVGFIDCTLIPLLYAPSEHHRFYYNSKSSYALHAIVVCSDEHRIIYTRAGDVCTAHESFIFEDTMLSLNPEVFFSPREYLIGDSAFTVNRHMITPFKKPRANEMDCKIFNAILNSQRIAVEHTLGLVKARFPAITAVPVKVKGWRSHKLVVDYFQAACVLHNFLLDMDDGKWDDKEDIDIACLRQELAMEEQAKAELAPDVEKGFEKPDGRLREALLRCMVALH